MAESATRAIAEARENPHGTLLVVGIGMRSAVVAACLLVASSAFAQPGLTDPVPAQPVEQVPELKSGALAVSLSLGATLGSFAVAQSNAGLGIVGLIVGPSFGRWYTGELGGIGLAGRFAGALLILKGISADEYAAECEGEDCSGGGGSGMIYGGLILWGAATIYDFVEAGRGADRYNRKHAIRVAPTLLNQQTPGLALGMQF